MRSLQQGGQSDRYRIRFDVGDHEDKRFLKTKDSRVANSILGRVEETFRLMEHGRIEVPEGADLGCFVLADGEVVVRASEAKVRRAPRTAAKTTGRTTTGRGHLAHRDAAADGRHHPTTELLRDVFGSGEPPVAVAYGKYEPFLLSGGCRHSTEREVPTPGRRVVSLGP